MDKREQNKKLVKTLFIVTATVCRHVGPICCYVCFTTSFFFIRNQYSCAVQSASYVGRFTQLANSLLNPIIYCFRMPEFNKILKQGLFSGRRANIMNVQSGEAISSANIPVAVCE